MVMAARMFQETKGIRRIQSVLAAAVRQGQTIKQLHGLISLADPQGKSVRNQTLGKYRKAVLAAERYNERLKFLGKDTRPDPDKMPNALTNIRKKFSITVKVEGILDGRAVTRHSILSSDTVLGQPEAQLQGLEMQENMFRERYPGRVWQGTSALMINAIKNPYMV